VHSYLMLMSALIRATSTRLQELRQRLNIKSESNVHFGDSHDRSREHDSNRLPHPPSGSAHALYLIVAHTFTNHGSGAKHQSQSAFPDSSAQPVCDAAQTVVNSLSTPLAQPSTVAPCIVTQDHTLISESIVTNQLAELRRKRTEILGTNIDAEQEKEEIINFLEAPPSMPIPSPSERLHHVDSANSAAENVSLDQLLRPQFEVEKFEAALSKTFPNISPVTMSSIIQNATRKIGTPGATIFQEGEVSSDMIFLSSGCLHVQKCGRRTATIDCSNIVGHHAYMYHRPRSATVTVGSGLQCVYYIFCIDRVSDEVVMKSAALKDSVPSKTKFALQDSPAACALSDQAVFITAEHDDGHFSPLSKRRMSLLLGDEESSRIYSRDLLDPPDFVHNGTSPAVGSCEHLPVQPPLSPALQPASATESVSSERQDIIPGSTEELVFDSPPFTVRPASAQSPPAVQPHRLSAESPVSPPRPASSRPRTSSTVTPHTMKSNANLSRITSPRFSADAEFASAASGRTLENVSSKRSEYVPVRRLSIVGRAKEAVQQQLSSSSASAVSCIMFSAAWLMCLTQLEKARMPAARHAVCRQVHELLVLFRRCNHLTSSRQMALLVVTDDESIKFVDTHVSCALYRLLYCVSRYLCARLRMLTVPSPPELFKTPLRSPPTSDACTPRSQIIPCSGAVRSLLHDAGLSPEIVRLLPDPSLIVEILSEVAMNQHVNTENSCEIMALMTSLLRRCIFILSANVKVFNFSVRNLRHAVVSSFLRVCQHYLAQQAGAHEAIILMVYCPFFEFNLCTGHS
jgi:hypothetical protein